MNVEHLMTRDSRTCDPSQTLDCAARIMWEEDCGVVPVVDSSTRRAVGVITDRDICMAAYTKNVLLNQIPISSIAMKPVVAVRPHDSAQVAEDLMRKHQVRRLIVVDDRGHLVGILSLNDIARASGRSPRDLPSEEIAKTLAAISEPRGASPGAVA